MNNPLLIIARVALVLALVVIVLGAYVRLSDAGLGCPDWPGCYGNLLVPDHVDAGNENLAVRPLEQAKAWKEMVHRYVASTLGFLILIMAVMAGVKSSLSGMRGFSLALLVLVIFQGMLGMWTVTLLLKPVIVMSHLLGGLTILSLLCWTVLRQQSKQGVFVSARYSNLLPIVIFAIIVLVLQISLGGWTSSNYAALACPDFPTCQGVWWPNMDFKEGFILWRGLGIDYEGGVLLGPARTAIHMAHRIGAIITFFTIFYVAMQAIRSGVQQLKLTGIISLILLITQVTLGIANIKFHIPLPVAVSHNGVAALLLLSLVTLLHHCLPEKQPN
ncbi:MAG TPA: heme A synthase [Thiotrichaceae bacterium]|jgi:cytochrome c oxidase assembly protein subunit 15|nr:heme A synthase [Thiotrichaceae bacterium]HIM08451.1 heme A synthase [Gammaproteobacteria bacterium]